MVTLSDCDKILKTMYLDVICDQMNNKTNAFFAAIKKGGEEVSGKTASAVCRYGVNGGMGSASETGTLPKSGGNNYITLATQLKNIYGTIEISDKALRSGMNSETAVVNVLNAEMDGLLEAAKFNLQRMLWQSGNGVLAKIDALTSHTALNYYPVTDCRHLAEGMIIDFVSSGGTLLSASHRITRVDRANSRVYFTPAVSSTVTIAANDLLTLQQSYKEEIYGIPYLFDSTEATFYGNVRVNVPQIAPYSKSLNATLSTSAIQQVLDEIEERSGNAINMIVGSYALRRKYISCIENTRKNVDFMNLDGGFKALSYNGIPVVADKFASTDDMYFFNTDDFKLVQLDDWKWIEGENGRVLMQLEKKPAFTGTLVKYANLLCLRPFGQGRLTAIS